MTLQTRAQQISAHVDGGQAVGLACSDPVAMTPIGVSGKFPQLFTSISHEPFFSLVHTIFPYQLKIFDSGLISFIAIVLCS